jgi:YgiT-type zinc finger domain-containing protein
MVSQCYFCGGRTVARLVTAENWWGGKLALVEDVPARVCEDCGEPYFEAAVCQRLDRLRQTPPPAHRTIEVPVYAFAEGS